MATTKSGSTETPRTTDPSAPVSGVHPTPEQAAAIIQRETDDYRQRRIDEDAQGGVRGVTPSAAELAEPIPGLMTSGSDNAKLAEDFVAEEEEAIKEGQARRGAYAPAQRTDRDRDRDRDTTKVSDKPAASDKP